jgi:AI-2E family transporter
LAPAVTLGAVIVFSLFMLADREFLRNKLLRLAGRGHLTATTRALDEAAQRVSRYLLLQSAVNIAYGSVVAIGLHLLGIPNALVWGVLSGVLRYVPYLGAIVATALPSLVALGAFADWHRALYVLGFYVVLEITTANFVEPYIYGSQTGVSALAILVSAIFWSLIWGPVGLLLSTPLTVCLVAFGRNLSSLEFLTVLLGDDPSLAPNVKVYQRLLADDPDEALAVATGYLGQNSLESLYDSVLVPVLAMAEQDRRRGGLSENQEALVLESFRDLVEGLNHHIDEKAGEDRVSQQRGFGSEETHCVVLAAPVRNEADEIAAVLLTNLVNQSGVRIGVLAAAPLKESLEQISDASPALVCISSVPPLSVRYTRALYRSIKQLHPSMHVIVGVWSFEGPTMSLQERIGITEPDKIATKLLDALQEIQAFARQPCKT